MITHLLLPLLFLLIALFLIMKHHFLTKPKKEVEILRSQGASDLDFKENTTDMFFDIKKAVQKDTNIKAFAFPAPGQVFLNFVDTNLIKEVLTNHKYYTKTNKSSEVSRIFNSRGITAAEGDQWKLHRKIVSEAFQYDLFNDMIPTIVETANEILDVSSNKQKAIMAPRDVERITSEVITRIFFGLKSGNVIINGNTASEEVTYIIKRMLVYNRSAIRYTVGMWAFNFTAGYRDLKQRIRNFREIFGGKIQERMQEIKANTSENSPSNKKRSDLLEILLQHRLKNNDDPSQTLSDEEILDEFSVFFLAGKDTTSLLITMCLYCYVTYPDWGQKIKAEISETIKEFSQLNLDTLNSMDNLTAFMSEVLRMYPPAPGILPRVANRDHYVGDFFVKKGYLINTLFIANHFNPKYFEEPESFNPSRWMKSAQSSEGWKGNPFAYLPFSAGQRNCIGKHLALMEAKVVLSLIIKNFDVEIEPGFVLKLGSPSIGYGPVPPIPITLRPITH